MMRKIRLYVIIHVKESMHITYAIFNRELIIMKRKKIKINKIGVNPRIFTKVRERIDRKNKIINTFQLH